MAQIQREGCDPRQHLALSDQYPVWRCQLAEWLGGVAWRSGLAEWLGRVAWQSGLAEWLGGVAWRSGLAEWLGGVAWRSVLAAHPALASPQINPRRSIQHGEFVRREIGNWLLSLSVSRSDCFRPPYCLRTSPTESCQLNRVPMPPTPREISHPEPQCTPRFPGAASAARGHPGVSRIAPRAI